ncbi:SRPBCC family protein [Ascidiimonas aurantiaca]|uniref:SRPBCC family protein n=1 Tax=Ascidiimonas aurantiaca TaxID=1685432 RepID=UPI0030EF8E07
MTILFYILGALVLVFVILLIIAPKTYDVSRTVEVSRPLPEVFNYLKLLKNQDEWSPWSKKDPNMQKEFTGTDGTVGAIYSWKGNKEVGEGEQEITGIEENRIIESRLRFFKPWRSESDAYISVEESGDNKTRVIWGLSGKNKFPVSILMIFMNMDKMVGKDFEEGLANLKSILEK